MNKKLHIALVGNPNVGKTSLFNALTGLNQRVGNYPGITVERKTGTFVLPNKQTVQLIDLPGMYSLNATSQDEEIALNTLIDSSSNDYPDVVIVVAEAEQLKRNLLLFTQVKDLGFPVILVINMADQMEKQGIKIDVPALEQELDTPVVLLSSRKKTGLETLQQRLTTYSTWSTAPFYDVTTLDPLFFEQWINAERSQNKYLDWIKGTQQTKVSSSFLKEVEPKKIQSLQHKETVQRYILLQKVIDKTYFKNRAEATALRYKADRLLTHPVWGYVLFFSIMLLVFQALFDWASLPMDFLEEQFASLSHYIQSVLPAGKLTDLLANGIIPGVGGVVIFVPQIAILFMFIALLEESGYMSRVVFLMDRWMRPFGLSGKSVVPLISGVACAIPAIMSARTIEDTKERLITILVTPFTTCSARIPVYVIIITLVIPDTKVWGFIGLQALVMTLMYFSGFFMALLSAWVLKWVIKSKRKSYFIVEMPSYKLPLLKNIGLTVVEKTKAFVWGAGKIILALSIVLWFLGAHGPEATFGQAEEVVRNQLMGQPITDQEMEDAVASYQLETSYIGQIGRFVEPVFAPLGYDWKISIAVLTSFAAREVFVGNLATLYQIGSHADEATPMLQRMKAEKRADGTPVFTLATGVSLLVFYAFAMQCASTLAITKKETNSWKWMMIQLFFMTAVAYLLAALAYQILSV